MSMCGWGVGGLCGVIVCVIDVGSVCVVDVMWLLWLKQPCNTNRSSVTSSRTKTMTPPPSSR